MHENKVTEETQNVSRSSEALAFSVLGCKCLVLTLSVLE